MDETDRNDRNESDAAAESTQVDAEPKKVLLGKRVIRAFGVRAGLRTGAGTTTGSSESDWCGRSR